MNKVAFAVAVIAVLLVGVVLGYGYAISQPGEKRQLLAEQEELKGFLDQQMREHAIAKKSAEVDRLANEALRLQLVDYGHEVSALKRDIEFYRSLMAPEDDDQGLAVHDLVLSFDELEQHYRFTVIAKQLGGGNPLLKGEVDVVLRRLGETGEQESLRLADLPDFSGTLPAKLRFRFFQNVTGAFKLPLDFAPVSITVTAKAGDQVVEREYKWDEIAGENDAG